MSPPLKQNEYYYYSYQFSPEGFRPQLNHPPPRGATPPVQHSSPSAPPGPPSRVFHQYNPPQYMNPQQQQQQPHLKPVQTVYVRDEAASIVSSPSAPSAYRGQVSSPPLTSPTRLDARPLSQIAPSSSASPMHLHLHTDLHRYAHELHTPPDTRPPIPDTPSSWPTADYQHQSPHQSPHQGQHQGQHRGRHDESPQQSLQQSPQHGQPHSLHMQQQVRKSSHAEYTPESQMDHASPSGAAHIQASSSAPTAGRSRRRSAPKLVADVTYPVNYPAHIVPPEMQLPTGPVDGWKVMPPRPEDVRPRRYASGVDERNFFTVLEYEINSQPIIWDYYTGYVHLTGIWKAIGNSKADIVKLLDNSPELEPVIKRVRGGFLKIQGTWVPFDVARRLAAHVCFYIRYALVPLFGPGFPDECTRPDQPGFGTLQLNMPVKGSETSNSGDSSSATFHSPSKTRVLAPAAPSLLHASISQVPQPLTHSATMHKPAPKPAYGHHHHVHHVAPQYGHGSHLTRAGSDSGFKRRGKSRTDSAGSSFSKKDFVRHVLPESRDIYDENVFEDEDAESISPPPLPRKVSLTNEQIISESPSEFLAMLKATRLLQQMSAGRPVKDVGGDFEFGGRQFTWDGSDRLDVLPANAASIAKEVPGIDSLQAKQGLPHVENAPHGQPEPTPPMEPTSTTDRRLPSLSKILNI